MIDLEKHAYMLQCYKCYNVTPRDFRAWDKGPKCSCQNPSARFCNSVSMYHGNKATLAFPLSAQGFHLHYVASSCVARNL